MVRATSPGLAWELNSSVNQRFRVTFTSEVKYRDLSKQGVMFNVVPFESFQ